jgi:hypothetical protein
MHRMFTSCLGSTSVLVYDNVLLLIDLLSSSDISRSQVLI